MNTTGGPDTLIEERQRTTITAEFAEKYQEKDSAGFAVSAVHAFQVCALELRSIDLEPCR